jgi:peptidoglycan/LPS O-acetylase OafA/YrhL
MSTRLPSEHNSVRLTHPDYRPDIDGLRAIAVLSVVGFHAFPSLVAGGFIGVDIFFVISGFLISTIIIGSLERNSFSFIEFYSRRVNRIFPALLLVMISICVFSWFALLADEFKQLGKHIAGGAGFVSNFVLWSESGYFDNAAETKPLLHLWSLGVEEQYYILWPLLLWMGWKNKFNLLAVTIAVAAISFSLNIKEAGSNAAAAFYSPQTRFWELMAGSVLAYMALHKQEKLSVHQRRVDAWLLKLIHVQTPGYGTKAFRNIQSLLGAILILAGVFVIDKDKAFPGWWALLPTLGTVLIISANNQSWINRTVLSNRILIWLGLISFPLYLWHWPLLSFARIVEGETPSLELRLGAIFISIALAYLTYRFIEIPVRFGKKNKTKAITLFAAMIIVGFMGYATYLKNGLAFRHAELNQINAQFDWTGNFENALCRKVFPNFRGDHCAMAKAAEPTVILLGDSHSNNLYPGLKELMSGTADNILNLAHGGCLPFFDVASFQQGEKDVCMHLVNNILKFIAHQDTLRVVVISFRGPLYLSGKGYGNVENELVHNRIIYLASRPEISDFHEIFKVSMKNTIEYLLKMRKQVIFVLDTPELGFDPRTCVDSRPLRLTNKVMTPCAISKQDFDRRNKEYRDLVSSVLKEFPAVKIFDEASLLCDAQWCWGMKDGRMLYRDDDHLSIEGSRYISRELIKLIEGESSLSASNH